MSETTTTEAGRWERMYDLDAALAAVAERKRSGSWTVDRLLDGFEDKTDYRITGVTWRLPYGRMGDVRVSVSATLCGDYDITAYVTGRGPIYDHSLPGRALDLSRSTDPREALRKAERFVRKLERSN